ncbi:MAG: 5-formyltetrahydrofolate cyclo-ligase [Barnesiella sp.]|nr:5-formyltetrahydrofolate cyclo-ligase [Barnesiella sp.]
MDKDDIRRRVRARKSLLTDSERINSARNVFEKLEKLAAFAMSNRILIYNSLPDELSTREFIDRWVGKKEFYLPRVNGIDLDILPYDRQRMHVGAFRIEEPSGDDVTDPSVLEMIIVPAVAYDRKGNRVGRGKGYYDRLLNRSNALRVGVAYDFQLFDDINLEPHDIPVDIVITETTMYRRRK